MPVQVQVAPITNIMPHTDYAAPSSSDVGGGGAPHARQYSAFLDVVLDHVCCAADDSRHRGSVHLLPTRRHHSESGQWRPSSSQAQTHHHQQRHSEGQLQLNQSTSSFSHVAPHATSTWPRGDRRGSVILPHLRFNPLPPGGAVAGGGGSTSGAVVAPGGASLNVSSLNDFFALFLADDAPHSFGSFHKKNGDENVAVTRWKTHALGDDGGQKQYASSSDVADNITRLGQVGGGETKSGNINRSERTITFQTKISPGSSSNPLAQSEHTNSSGSSSSSNVIPLNVTIVQSLIQHTPKRWKLECEFSFDFSSQSKLSAGGLGTGLGQFLMSNVIRGSNVSVAVSLSECDETSMALDAAMNNDPLVMPSKGDASVASYQNHPSRCLLPPCHENGEGFLPCLSHPLLMPPDGLCSVPGRGSSPHRQAIAVQATTSFEEPSRVGATLLSAIRAKNAPTDAGDERGPATDASLAKNHYFLSSSSRFERLDDSTRIQRPDVGNNLDDSSRSKLRVRRKSSNSRRQQQRDQEQHQHQHHEDVLSTSSRGAPMAKPMPSSFELSRAPSTETMRRLVLEREVTDGGTGGVGRPLGSDSPTSNCSPNSVADPGDILLHQHSATALAVVPPQGLSMRIQMDVSGNNNDGQQSTASSLSSSFSRSASITAIDEKVRRGLQKRIARSWITWAESWCMRLWEEERADICTSGRRSVALGGGGESGGGRRVKSNVRPSVRRIGEPKRPPSPKDAWRPLTEKKDNPDGRTERWMSLEYEGEEVGVEVSATLPPTPKPARHIALEGEGREGPSMPDLELDGGDPPAQGRISKKSKMRLLRGFSNP